MFSIGKKKPAFFNIAFKSDGTHNDGAHNDGALDNGAHHIVNRMARPIIRRTQRLMSDILSGHKRLPSHCGTITTLAFFMMIVSYGISVGGHGKITLGNITAAIGFSIGQIKVTGNIETSDIDIMEKLELDEQSSLFTFDLAKAHQGLSRLPWVEQIELFKTYPHSLHVNLVEREAFAIWQQGQQLSLIEKNGRIIENYNGLRKMDLPLFVGLGAQKHAAEMYGILSAWPEFMQQTKAIIRVADRRWDIRLKNGITLHLPEGGIDAALAHLTHFNQSHNVLKRDIAAVDLRLADRTTIRLTQEALKRRKTALSERAKALLKEKNT